MNGRYSTLKHAMRLIVVGISALVLSLIGLPLTLLSTAAVYEQLKMVFAGEDPFIGKGIVSPALFVASAWLLKMAIDLWYTFRDLVANRGTATHVSDSQEG